MRYVHTTVPVGKQKAVLELLDDEDVEYTVNVETSGQDHVAIVSFPLPQNAVEPILDRLRDIGLDEDGSIVILDAKAVVSRRFEQLRASHAERGQHVGRIAREELRSEAETLAPAAAERWSYVVMTVISAVVATGGLLLDSAAVVVGSMVIAPLIGPAMATGVGSVIGDGELAFRGMKLQVLGILLSVVSAAILGVFVRFTGLIPPTTAVFEIPEVNERLAPDFLSLIIAFGAGAAGAVSLTTGTGAALVGVMIAVALIPPAAALGITIAWGQPIVGLGAGVLVLVNVLSINLMTLIVLWFLKYRPRDWSQLYGIRSAMRRRIVVLVAAILVLSTFLGGVTYLSNQHAAFEQEAEHEAHVFLDANHPELAVVDVTVESDVQTTALEEFGIEPDDRSRVLVTVSGATSDELPELAHDLDRHVTRATGHDVVVEVEFVDAQASD